MKRGRTLLYGVRGWMHITGMLMRGHRSMEGLSYVSERLDTDTRGGREVTEEMRRLCCKGG